MKYWLLNCPFCDQGRVFAMEQESTRTTFLLCEECDGVWQTSQDAGSAHAIEKMKPIPERPFDYASADAIARSGWLLREFTPVE